MWVGDGVREHGPSAGTPSRPAQAKAATQGGMIAAYPRHAPIQCYFGRGVFPARCAMYVREGVRRVVREARPGGFWPGICINGTIAVISSWRRAAYLESSYNCIAGQRAERLNRNVAGRAAVPGISGRS